MKIEYLADAPLIRIFDFDLKNAESLKTIFESLAAGEYDEIILTDAPGVTPIGGCSLHLRVVQHDDGVTSTPSPPHFEWLLSPKSWTAMAEMTEPFRQSLSHADEHYQWLDSGGRIALLLSPTGKW